MDQFDNINKKYLFFWEKYMFWDCILKVQKIRQVLREKIHTPKSAWQIE